MSHDPSISRAPHGSYVQLNTFDDKENIFVQVKPSFTSVLPYERCLCTRRDTIIIGIVLLGTFIIITTSLAIGLPKIHEKRELYFDTSFPVSSSQLMSYGKAVVLTDGEPCATIGKNILLEGGTAVDAALAALFCDGTVNPQSMGFGGGFLMTIYNRANNTSTVIDARETAPKSASKDMFQSNSTRSLEGGLSIAVPGELKGYWLAHQKYGKISWRKLIEPSIKLCNDGIRVTEHLASRLKMLKKRILNDDSMREEFFNNETNDLFKEGEMLKRPQLAKTMNEIADKGADVLYTGDLHKKFLEDLSNCGSIITEADLAEYSPKLKPAVKVEINNADGLFMHSVPPPGSGLILSFILNILSHYNITSADAENTDKAVLMYHRIAEAFKFGFAHRTQLGDDAFINITQLVSNLQSLEYAKTIKDQISDEKTFPPDHYKPVMETDEDSGTAHVSVLAENGDAVSVTSTINTYFGSLCRSSNTGIILNNAMNDFSSPNITNYFGVPPSPANYIVSGKRPLSSMSPAIIVDNKGDVKMIVGGTGGTRIITASALGIIRTLWLSEDIKEATDALRIHHQLFPNYIQYEKSFPKVYLDELKRYGHSVKPETQRNLFLGIVREDNNLKPAFSTNVDFRKSGSADGY